MIKPFQFLKQTKNELTHVTWPTRLRAIVYSLIVIVFSLGVGYLLGGFDQLFRVLLRSVIIK